MFEKTLAQDIDSLLVGDLIEITTKDVILKGKVESKFKYNFVLKIENFRVEIYYCVLTKIEWLKEEK